jgi:tripartite-type tricarboxylate transporter receptor subunit TctC
VQINHIPYRGTAAAITDVVAGVVDLMFTGPPAAKAMSAEGKLRLLAVASLQRVPSMPDVPTVSESGVPGFEMAGWFGLLAPAKTPQPIIERLLAEVSKAVHDPRFSERMIALGLQAVGGTPAQMLAMMQADTQKWAELIKSANIKIEQ